MITHEKAEERVMLGFWIHAAAYALVIVGLAVLNFTRNPDNLWFLWVAGGWGIGIAAHATAVCIGESRERMVQRTTERLERRESQRNARQT